MSDVSSSAAAWFTRLEPTSPPTDLPARPDDSRLGSCIEFWAGGAPDLWSGRPVLLGFPQDEGVRRNHGRPGAAEAPGVIRHWFYRLTPWDDASDADLAALRLLDLGDVRLDADLEAAQDTLGDVLAALLTAGAVPLVLGGGHETAFGHFLGYVKARLPVGIVNLDAHLDVRPWSDGRGHSGSPFRQALEHPTQPLPGERYVCLGAQPFAVSRIHLDYVRQRGGTIRWRDEVAGRLGEEFEQQCQRLVTAGCQVYVTLDSDVVRSADVPGVSAPNPLGLSASDVTACVRRAGAAPGVSSFDVVEINPSLDVDGHSARWAALVLWHFLAGLASRPMP